MRRMRRVSKWIPVVVQDNPAEQVHHRLLQGCTKASMGLLLVKSPKLGPTNLTVSLQ